MADEVLEIVNARQSLRFSLTDLYSREGVFASRFPRNQHLREKIRQTLQRLRDLQVVLFLGGGEYALAREYPEFQWEPARSGESGICLPETRTVIRRVRLRDTLLAAEMKRRYANTCQVCHEALPLAGYTYAESHHIRPLAPPHSGPDIEGNILVVCPNHHVMLDRGALRIDPVSLVVSHVCDAIQSRPLLIHAWHLLNRRVLDYYCSEICGKAAV